MNKATAWDKDGFSRNVFATSIMVAEITPDLIELHFNGRRLGYVTTPVIANERANAPIATDKTWCVCLDNGDEIDATFHCTGAPAGIKFLLNYFAWVIAKELVGE